MRCVVLDDYERAAAESADWTGIDVRFVHDRVVGAALVEMLQDAEVVVLMRERTPFPRALVAALPQLRLVVTTGTRNPSIDLTACAEHGIVVCGTRGSTHAAAELTWALILAAARRLPAAMTVLRDGGWASPVGMELAGRRLGLIGLGRLGSTVARYGLTFGMDVVAWSPNLTPERCADASVAFAGRDELLSTSDIVSLHLVLGPTTRGLIGASELSLMKPSAWLVNTSRAGLVDTAALAAACTSGTIAGAAVDVFDDEPVPPGTALLACPNIIATAHIGYVTDASFRTWFTDVVADIHAFADGAPVRVISDRPGPAPD